MSAVADMVTGKGRKDAKRQQAEAARRAQIETERSRQAQSIANDRQLAALNNEAENTGATRKAPRGRRLFMSDETSGGLATTLGG